MRPLKVHFSCGAASAVSLLLAVESGAPVSAVYADTGGEHPDNLRFMDDIAKHTGVAIKVLRSKLYASPMDVWRRKRFISGPRGAPCTSELKRLVLRDEWDCDADHVFGFDRSERHRLERIQDLEGCWPRVRSLLIERDLSKQDCFSVLQAHGLRLPEMYRLGFNNANCIGCPKGGAGYWNHIRRVFPEHFEDVARLQRELGEGSFFLKGRRSGDPRISLDQLHPSAGRHSEASPQCDMFCSDLAERVGAPVRGAAA